MAHRALASLLILHRGVPIGHTTLIELETIDTRRVPAKLRAMIPALSPFMVNGFEPLPGYEAVRSVVQRANQAAAKLGYLGPVDDPDSDVRGREARRALEQLCAELEFRDTAGGFVSVDVDLFVENPSGGQPYFALGGTIDEAAATVLAKLHGAVTSGSGHQPPGD